MELTTFGVIGTSLKPHEKRVPIHPGHLDRIPAELRSRIVIEIGYGERFGVSDRSIGDLGFRLAPRDEVLRTTDTVLLFKPVLDDVRQMRAGQTLWGCPHFVQDRDMTQLAIDRRISVMTIEGMRHWSKGDGFDLFVFHRVSELAGYCSVLHALEATGKSGLFGGRLSAVVFGYGSTGRGAVTALQSLGVTDLTVATLRAPATVAAQPNAARAVQFADTADGGAVVVTETGVEVDVDTFVAGTDIVVNCILQDPRSPIVLLDDAALQRLPSPALFVDVSCDNEMGFSWASPTTFSSPIRDLGAHKYYAVDHSPSLLWDAASAVISEALLPYLPTVMGPRTQWWADPTIDNAVEMVDGHLRNQTVVDFQMRAIEYPHAEIGVLA
ncbi:alanine dehydrogenase [Williamsia sp.]|uniref:alanine dehydrogenase n=1 Tax=Williamsia sp. TaxID=1872085 RepID=UPI001A2380A6|nr:alanine dehydrogenase [Williamsia sp.]MBJ7291446.1 alanine dehydrogenase [Williamsia sp.]